LGCGVRGAGCGVGETALDNRYKLELKTALI